MLSKLAYRTFISSWFALTSRISVGTQVYEKDWDVLVLLDTCRPDALKEVAGEFDWIPDDEIQSTWSIASNSRGWIAGTFTEKYRSSVERTVYINANGYSTEILESSRRFPSEDGIIDLANWGTLTSNDLLLHHPVRDYKPEFRLSNHVPPQLVTDRAVTAYQDYNPRHLIVHYHQPHAPYRYHAIQEERDLHDWEKDPFTALKNGTVNHEEVWEAYLDELRYVLGSVDDLRQVLDVETIAISADHGEAFGEYGLYRHMLGIPHPNMKKVPWVEIPGTGMKKEYETDYPISDANQYEQTQTEDEITERLRSLGYSE